MTIGSLLPHRDALDAFLNIGVKGTDYGPPSNEGVQSLRKRLQGLSLPLLEVSQRVVNIYLLEAGQDYVSAGRELFDPQGFPSKEDEKKIKELQLALKDVDRRHKASGQRSPEAFAPYKRELFRLADEYNAYGVLGINVFSEGTSMNLDNRENAKTFGQLAARRVGQNEGLEYELFLRQIRDVNPHLFAADLTVQEIGSKGVFEFPSGQYSIIPGYSFETTDTGRKCVWVVDVEDAYSWKVPSATALGRGATKARSASPSIYLSSPVKVPRQSLNQNVPLHELSHAWDAVLKRDETMVPFHAELYNAARETFEMESIKPKGRKKLSDILPNYALWSNTAADYIPQYRRFWTPNLACQELIGYTGGFAYFDHPEKQFRILAEHNPYWAKMYRAFITKVESLATGPLR